MVITCISDTHNKHHEIPLKYLQGGDCIIHSGDISSRGTKFEIEGFLDWFDELLDTQMKICRGSGVLVFVNNQWKIKHYVLSMTFPNDNTDEVIKIKAPIEDALIIDLKGRKEQQSVLANVLYKPIISLFRMAMRAASKAKQITHSFQPNK